MEGFLIRASILLGAVFLCVALYFIITEGPKAFFKAFFGGLGEGLLRGIGAIVIWGLIILAVIGVGFLIYYVGGWLIHG